MLQLLPPINFLLFGSVAMWRLFALRQCLLLLLLILFFYIPAGAEAASSSSRSLSIGNELAVLGYNNAFSIKHDYRKNYCDSHNSNNTSSTPAVGDLLNGKKLNVLIASTLTTSSFNYDEETGIGDPGFYANVLDMMAEQGNFTWRNSFGYVDWSSIGSNKSFTEFIKWGIQHYDIVVGTWYITANRINEGISFTSPVFSSPLIMIRNVEPSVNRIAYFNWLIPFENEVWLVVLAVIIISSFIFQFLEYIGNGREDRSFRKWTKDNIYLGFLNFTQNFSHEPKTLGGCIFAISFSFWAMLVGAAYTANLTSYLVEGSRSGFVLVNIEDAIARDMSICVVGESAQYSYMIEKYPESKSLLIPLNLEVDEYTALNKKECELLVTTKRRFDQLKLQAEYNPYCYLKWEGREITTFNEAFATTIDPDKCTSIVNEVFNYYITSMRANITLDWDEQVLREATREPCDNKNPSATTTEDNNRRRMMTRRNLIKSDDYGSGDESSTGSTISGHHDHRYLENGSGSGSDSGNSSGGRKLVTESEDSLSLKQMTGTFLVHVLGSFIAIVVSLLSLYERKKNVKRHSKKLKTTIQVNAKDFTEQNINGYNTTDTAIIGGEGVHDSVHTTPMHNELLLQNRLDRIESSQKKIESSQDMIISMLNAIQKEIKSNGNNHDDDGIGIDIGIDK